MPLYEYECEAGHRFERIQKFSDPPVEKCPVCGKPTHRLISSPAIQFKGSGWYVTDYARKSEKTESTGKSEAGPSTTETAGAKPADSGSTAKESPKDASKESAKGSKDSPKPAADKATPGSKS
ncbi:MAG: FmdB family zinc ribbon protein [Acidobacteriota bacterium]